MNSNCAQRYWSPFFLCSAIHWLYSIFWAKTNKFYTPSMSWGAFVIILLIFQVILHVRYPGFRELVLFIVFTLLREIHRYSRRRKKIPVLKPFPEAATFPSLYIFHDPALLSHVKQMWCHWPSFADTAVCLMKYWIIEMNFTILVSFYILY